MLEDRKFILEKINEYRVTCLINNAGILSRGEFANKSLVESHRVIELNIGSINSYISSGNQSIYCRSKAFVKSFSLGLEEELKNTKMTVSCLFPDGNQVRWL